MHVSHINVAYSTSICVGVLPFADMTLLTANSASAIIVSAGLAMCCLNEVFFWKYDLPAILLLLTGSATIILQSDTTDKSYDSEQIASLLTDT